MLGENVVIGIVGSRERNSVHDYDLVLTALRQLVITEKLESIIICSGGAYDGADDFAKSISEQLEIPLLLHLPNWKKRGKAGGPLRNKKIAESSDYLIACWDGKSKGTKSCVSHFKELGKEERLYVV